MVDWRRLFGLELTHVVKIVDVFRIDRRQNVQQTLYPKMQPHIGIVHRTCEDSIE